MADLSRHNASGCADLTAYDALLPMVQADAALEARTTKLIKTLKSLIDLAGYDLVARIEVRDRSTGRVFR